MKKLTYSGLNVDVYEEVLANGLTIYVLPLPKFVNIFATFTTKYGSVHSTFKTVDEEQFHTVNPGIAHFLEHKLFENEDGTDPFAFFSKSGANNNANTSNFRTTYIFSGSQNFSGNLNYLIDFVQSPYITDENVLKEKGIITQEAKMYMDIPYWRMVETAQYNTFINDPHKIPVIGTLESINNITKEELMLCYNTFYHPSNMFITITGAVDPQTAIDIIKNNQDKKNYGLQKPIINPEIEEPDNVALAFEEIKMDVVIPKIAINYKINFANLGVPLKEFELYMDQYLAVKFSTTSVFTNQLIDNQLIIGDLMHFTTIGSKHLVLNFVFESKQAQTVIVMIDEEIKKIEFNINDFNRKKKTILASLVRANDSIFSSNYRILENIVTYGDVFLNAKDIVTKMNTDELMAILKNINFDNRNIVIINPLN